MIKKLSLKKEELIKITKYLFSAGSSLILDLILFTFFNFLFQVPFIATILARIISSLYNYFLNSRIVFQNYTKDSIIKYYILVVIQMLISASTIQILTSAIESLNDTLLKLLVDMIIFVINYFVQKEIIFK